MFQRFNTDTLGGRFIKSFLAQTPIPLFDAVIDGDRLVKGCYYVYRTYIIECVVSGQLYIDKNEVLYPSDTLYPSAVLYPAIGIRAAKFYVRSIVDVPHIKTHSTYNSTSNSYDSETHYHLGRYLRYLKTRTGLNLLPFYNCFNSTYFEDVELTLDNHQNIFAKKVLKQNYKVVGVPILYGHTYTIAIDCPTKVLMKAIIHDNSGYVEESELSSDIVQDIKQTGRCYSSLNFRSPVLFRVETTSAHAMSFERNLYLAIQLPLNNISSIVVLENYDDINGISCDDRGVQKRNVINPSLLLMNTKQTYAFSDRLLEYLVGNVIHNNDPIKQNIELVQTLLCNMNFEYKSKFISGVRTKGVWDSDLSNQIFKAVENSKEASLLYDQDGYFNKDVQKLIHSGG